MAGTKGAPILGDFLEKHLEPSNFAVQPRSQFLKTVLVVLPGPPGHSLTSADISLRAAMGPACAVMGSAQL